MQTSSQQQATATLEVIKNYFMDLQDRICAGLEEEDGKASFEEDKWERPGGGGGRSRVIANGKVFEKGGVNFSHVFGEMPEAITQKLGLSAKVHFDAMGVSLVIHPESPRVPIVHMNVRYFQTGDGTHWFGGGIDLTPIYVVPEDATHFHKVLKSACDPFGEHKYPEFKAWCDRYFFLKHRNETRGIGGIFFDHLKASNDEEKAENFAFVRSVGDAFLDAYRPIVAKSKTLPYQDSHKNWQLLRRSRYVEFNLVYDKGTKFGLDTNGRTESILMSMPPLAAWKYNYQPEDDSEEAFTQAHLKPLDWLSI
ncbi:MAG: oxygen-dependent coproporphyrinogen oxidase [Bacteroidota bacterium]